MSAYSSDKDVPFASHKEVLAACNTIEDSPAEFLNQFVADDVHWTVTSPSAKSTPIAGEMIIWVTVLAAKLTLSCDVGVYTSRQEFMEKALKPLSEHFAEPLKLRIGEMVVETCHLYACILTLAQTQSTSSPAFQDRQTPFPRIWSRSVSNSKGRPS